jgi:hypothetical protein
MTEKRPSYRERQHLGKETECPMCGKRKGFLWSCPCGFFICDECMRKDLWGFTCNNVTWLCPDCGKVRSY